MYSSHVFIYHVSFIHPRHRRIAAPPAPQALFIVQFIHHVSPTPLAHIIHPCCSRIAAPPAPQPHFIQFIYYVSPAPQTRHCTTRATGTFHQVHPFIHVVIQPSFVHHPCHRCVSPFAPPVQFTFHFQFRLNSSRAAGAPLLARQRYHGFSHRRPHTYSAILFFSRHLTCSFCRSIPRIMWGSPLTSKAPRRRRHPPSCSLLTSYERLGESQK
jgi:hypothetical protein